MTDDQERWMRTRVGYGRLDAPYWFVGMEERGQSDEVQERMRAPSIEDVADAHRTSFGGRYRALFNGEDSQLQPTWKMLIRCLLVATSRPASEKDVRRYQGEEWGRSDGDTLLTELFPTAAPSVEVSDYKAELLPARVRLLRQLYREYSPRFVVAYGRPYWPHFQRIFEPSGKTRWLSLPSSCGPGRRWRNVALIEHPTAKGQTNDRFNALGEWAKAFVPMEGK